MVHSKSFESEVTLFSGFSVRASLQDKGDGYDIILAYTRKGRRVGWIKNRIECNAVNQAREELIEYLAKLGWCREVDPIHCQSRWTPPEPDNAEQEYYNSEDYYSELYSDMDRT